MVCFLEVVVFYAFYILDSCRALHYSVFKEHRHSRTVLDAISSAEAAFERRTNRIASFSMDECAVVCAWRAVDLLTST